MTQGYRAVLADCERALGRPEVALRLVAEALADKPDPEETVELRIVESGARLDLGEAAAARLVLEAELGGRLDPASLESGDAVRLRLASAYADLLEIQGENDRAMDWLVAIAAADPEDVTGAVERLGIEFTELEEIDLDEADLADADADTDEPEPAAAGEHAPQQPVADPAAPEVVDAAARGRPRTGAELRRGGRGRGRRAPGRDRAAGGPAVGDDDDAAGTH